MTMHSSTAPSGIPAATLVVFRHSRSGGPPELLMLERAMHMRFAPGMAVFPGGRVDLTDFELAARIAEPGLSGDEAAHRVAALRETLEETGLVLGVRQAVTAEAAAAARELLIADGTLATVLERFGWTLDLDQLIPFARWCPDHAKAFDARFYLADLGTGAVDLTVDGTENGRLFWSSAADTLAAAATGGTKVIFPTQRNLERLAQFADFAAAAEHAAGHPVRTITPREEPRDGVPHLVIPDDRGYPVTSQLLADVLRMLD